ncbi:hypothetical protein [Stappia indica]|uniref:hypothetical protein n=1 Tax=Stappia indica TaxID=538381 RepID=UPI001D1883E5|nr:hypothetical protein [Stappia indica]MCC4246590.1 hypothetical protein [Stappia indica]
MKAVDFIVEIPSHILLLEIKDPDHPRSQEKDRINFIKKIKSGALDVELTQKYRDSWIYLKASGDIPKKPLRYFVLIACESLTPAELTVRTDELKRKLPLKGIKGQDWSWFVEDCAVFNLRSWNRKFPQIPVERI